MNVFQLAENDQSVMYLGQIFGNVGVALAGAGPALLSQMFKTFNTILLVIGTIFIVYITVVGVLTTAHEGEFMKKWNSLWTPLRMLIGIVALFPTASGYCAIQVVIMWIILQGVGAADMVWKTTIDYVAKGGALNPSPGGVGPEGGGTSPGALGLSGSLQNLFTDVVCQAAVAKFWPYEGGTQLGKRDQIGKSQLASSGMGYTFGPNGICGSVSWNVSIPGNLTEEVALKTALGSMYTTLVPVYEAIANNYVNSIIDDPGCWQPGPCLPPPSPGLSAPWCYFGKWTAPNFSSPSCSVKLPALAWQKISSYAGSNFYKDAIVMIAGYANNYAVNQQVNNARIGIGTDIKGAYKRAQVNGWIFAGAYYYYMAQKGNQSQVNTTNFYQNISIADITNTDAFKKPPQYDWNQGARNPPESSFTMFPIRDIICNWDYESNTCRSAGGGKGIIITAKQAMAGAISEGGGAVVGQGGSSGGGPMGEALQSGGDSIVQTWMTNLSGAATTEQNPIVNVQYFGKSCLITAEVLFWLFFGVTLVVGALQTNVVILGTTANYLQGVASAILTYFIPVMFFFLVYLVSIGALLGVYVPLIPFILFTFGAIGWFIAVIEAMVAAPIVALGILSPGGQHEIMSRAEPSIMILMNIFLRPTLMVFGMMAAMLLSYVVMRIINGAFLEVIGSIGGTRGSGLLQSFLFIMAYAGLVVTALNKCFSLIHILPDKVLRWIGGHPESYGEAEAAEAVKGKVTAGGEAGGRATGAVGGAAQSEFKAGKGSARGERTHKKGDKTLPPRVKPGE